MVQLQLQAWCLQQVLRSCCHLRFATLESSIVCALCAACICYQCKITGKIFPAISAVPNSMYISLLRCLCAAHASAALLSPMHTLHISLHQLVLALHHEDQHYTTHKWIHLPACTVVAAAQCLLSTSAAPSSTLMSFVVMLVSLHCWCPAGNIELMTDLQACPLFHP
jgi:hypothetical protein